MYVASHMRGRSHDFLLENYKVTFKPFKQIFKDLSLYSGKKNTFQVIFFLLIFSILSSLYISFYKMYPPKIQEEEKQMPNPHPCLRP
jgi:hypothetical protein